MKPTKIAFWRSLCLALFGLLIAAAPARALSEWDNVERVVVIGDLHGDYDKFADMLSTAGLIDAAGNWSGGATHLVQLGDVPDRGANSRMIMDLLMRLSRRRSAPAAMCMHSSAITKP